MRAEKDHYVLRTAQGGQSSHLEMTFRKMQTGANGRQIKGSKGPTSVTWSLEWGQASPAAAPGQLRRELPHVPARCSQPEHSCKH